MDGHKSLSAEVFECLRQVDTPTLSNAIEAFKVRERITGFAGHRVRCIFPKLGSAFGYAVTAQIDATSPGPPATRTGLREILEIVEAAPKPVVLLYQDIGPRPGGAACTGEYSAAMMKRLGVVAFVCDSAIRDVNEVEAVGLQCFATGSSASHGNLRRVRLNVPVLIDGLYVEPGDLVHGDVNGLITVPFDIADKLPSELERVRALERKAIDFVQGPDFTLDTALKLMGF